MTDYPQPDLYVRWQLLRKCNYNCAWCKEDKTDNNLVLLKDRLLGMAASIFMRQPQSCHFLFTGGEATLHFCLQELVNFIYSQKKQVWITLESNGSQSVNYYQSLIKYAPKEKFQLSLAVHPAVANLNDLLLLVASISEKRQAVHIRYFFDLANQEKSQSCLQALLKLHSITPFSLEFNYTSNIYFNPRPDSREHNFKVSIEQHINTNPGIIKFPQFPRFARDNAERVKNNGKSAIDEPAEYLFIEPDGRFSVDPDSLDLSSNPLWEGASGLDKENHVNLNATNENLRNFIVFDDENLELTKDQLETKAYREHSRANNAAHADATYKKHVITPIDNQSGVEISFIISCANQCEELSASIDSILAQCVSKYEILVIRNLKNIATEIDAILGDYALHFPSLVKIVSSGAKDGRDEEFNRGLNAAFGRYIVFIEAGDIFESDMSALELNEKADIIHSKNGGSSKVDDDVSSFCQQPEAFINFLSGSSYNLYGKLYRRGFLLQNNIYFKPGSYSDIKFNLTAFASAKTILCSAHAPYLIPGDHIEHFCAANDYLEELLTIIQEVRQCFNKCKIDPSDSSLSSFYGYLCTTADIWLHGEINKGNIDIELLKDRLLALADYQELARAIVLNYIHYNYPAYCVLENNADKSLNAAEIEYEEYNGKVKEAGSAALTVVLTGDADIPEIEALLACLARQTVQNFELLAILPASARSRLLLEKAADIYPEIRLYLVDNNTSAGVSKNFAISKARGEYLIFTEGLDIFDADYLEKILAASAIANPDILLFSMRHKSFNGGKIKCELFEQSSLSSSTALEMFLQGQIKSPSANMVFKTESIKKANCRFGAGMAFEDETFLLMALAKARKVITDARIEVTNFEETSFPEAKPQHVLSETLSFCALLARTLDEIYGKNINLGICLSTADYIGNALARAFAWANNAGKAEVTVSTSSLGQVASQWLGLFAFLIGLPMRLPDHQPEKRAYLPEDAAAPLLSIVLETTNNENEIWLELDNLTRQIPANSEIIIVANGSEDSTLEICDSFRKNDGRIRIIKLDKCTDEIAAMHGLEQAAGKYIAFGKVPLELPLPFLLAAIARLANIPGAGYLQFVDILPFSEASFLNIQQCDAAQYLKEYCLGKLNPGGLSRKIFKREKTRAIVEIPPSSSGLILQTLLNSDSILFMETEEAVMLPTILKNAEPIRSKIDGFINAALASDKLLRARLQPDEAQALLARRMASLFKNTGGDLLFYLNACLQKGFYPLNENQLLKLAEMPELLRVILENYGKLYARQTNLKGGAAKAAHFYAHGQNELVLCHDSGNSTPLLAILTYARNAAAYIGDCVKTIISGQKANIRVILLEDWSDRDDTLDICTKLASTYPQIDLYRATRFLGPSVCFNKALAIIQAKYIIFADARARLDNRSLALLLSSLDSREEDAIFFNASGKASMPGSRACFDDAVMLEMILQSLEHNIFALASLKLDYIKNRAIRFGSGSLGYLDFFGEAFSRMESKTHVSLNIHSKTAGCPEIDFAMQPSSMAANLNSLAALFGIGKNISDPALAEKWRKTLSSQIWRQDSPIKSMLLSVFANTGGDSQELVAVDDALSRLISVDFVDALLRAFASDFAQTRNGLSPEESAYESASVRA